jgi:RNA polymerase sigma factor (TIGR02999 family)
LYKIDLLQPQDSSTFGLTRLLKAWSGGDAQALERLTPAVYAELRSLAQIHLAGERQGHLLQPTALVNEAFLRLIRGEPVEWNNRTHFFAVSARVMRQILVDFARAQNSHKRGSGQPHLTLSGLGIAAPEAPIDLIDLDTALNELAILDPRMTEVVELRYFGGLENKEIATVLGISEPTVVRLWRVARAWLYRRLRMSPGGSA